MPEESIPTPHFLSRDLASKYQTLLGASRAPVPNLREIAQLVREVPILKHRVLNVANGCAHGLSRTVKSTQQAVSLLGATRVEEIARQVLVENRHNSPPSPRGNTTP